MIKNYTTPLNLQIINNGINQDSFVPYKENENFNISSKGQLSFVCDKSEKVLYYLNQANNNLQVNVAAPMESEIETGHYNPSTDDLDPGAPYICKDPVKSEFEIHPTYFVLGGLNYYPETPEIGMPAGNRFEIKLRHSGITSRDDLPSHGSSVITITDGDGTAPRIKTFGRSAYQEDGTLIVVVNIKSKTASLDLLLHWTDDSEEDEKLTFYFNDTKFGKPGEKLPNVFSADITENQVVTLTNISEQTIGFIPFKENFKVNIEAGNSIELQTVCSEEAMYYLLQENNSLKVTL